MKHFFLWSLTLAVCVLSGCSDDYDDTELRNGLSDLKDRVAKLETQLTKLNGDITTMDALVKKLESNVSVVKVESSTDGKSYTISRTTRRRRLRTARTARRARMHR